MRSLRSQLIISHLLPLIIVVPLAAFGLIYFIETQVLLADLSEALTEQAEFIAEIAEQRPAIWQDEQEAKLFVTSVSGVMQTHVMLLQPNGHLLASNDPTASFQAGEPIDLPEMSVVVAGKRTVRIQSGVADVMVPVKDADEEVVAIVRVTNQLANVSERFWRLRQLVIAILALELLAGAAVGMVLALRLQRPLASLTTAVDEIAGGNRVEPLVEQGPTEVRQLVLSVNSLARRLHFLEETRRQLLSNLVHELGRPLGALRSAVHALRNGADEDVELRHELLAGMELELRTLQPLLDDLAQLHGQVLDLMVLERRRTAVSDWLASLLPPWRESALEKGLAWVDHIPADLPVVDMDPERMAQAVGNLLSNAIKHSHEGDSVNVTAGTNGSHMWIRISDTGPGIPLEEQDRIFEPFYRGKQEARFPNGLGLGLTIARDLIRAHEGHLELQSEPGVGSEFTIILPMQQP